MWYPFIKAYQENDHKHYNALHTDDVKRITKWGVKIGDTYKKSIVERYSQNKADGVKRKLMFRFEQRLTTQDYSYEIGYYKVEVSNPKKKEEVTFYGWFHVAMVKEAGVWKVAQDWDTGEIDGRKLTEEDFKKGQSKLYTVER